MKHILVGATAAFFALGTAATAASFSLDLTGAVFTDIPDGVEGSQAVTSPNDVLDGLQLGTDVGGGNYSLSGYQGAQVLFSGGGKVRVELFGWEAGFENTFHLDGQSVGKALGDPTLKVADNLNTPLASFVTGVLGAGVLDFEFKSANGNPPSDKGGVANGSNPIIGQNFFVSCGPGKEAATSCNQLWVFYDDSDVEGDNHDDLVVRISAVPLPAGALLLLTGMGALALRRRKSA